MRGFALNVSGLGGTLEEQEGAEKFVAYLASKGFKDKYYVIDTGRSGINRTSASECQCSLQLM